MPGWSDLTHSCGGGRMKWAPDWAEASALRETRAGADSRFVLSSCDLGLKNEMHAWSFDVRTKGGEVSELQMM